MRRTVLCAFAVLAIWPMSGEAQDMGWSTITPSVTGTDTLGLVMREQMRNSERRSYRPRVERGAPAAEAPIAVNLRYTPSRQRRAANYANFVAKSRARDPQGANNLARLFASTDVVEGMGRPLGAVGLRIDNVADAYAAWWINAWQASREIDDDVSRRMATAVSRQAAQAIASTGILRGAGDAAKQEMAESLLVQAALISDALKQCQGKPELSRKLAAAVSQGARGMNVDLAGMTLTEDGFVPADQAGEAGSRPGAQPAELAQAAPASGGDRPPYALIAAAGGAGLGGVVLLGRRMGRKA